MEKSCPVPDKVTVCGLPDALSAMARLADRDPAAVGMNTTLMLQLPAGARDVPQLLVWLKSPLLPPVTAMREIDRAAFPLLVNVTFCAVLELPTD
jgi:hypothetical protein